MDTDADITVPTLIAVAALAGVSKSTASRVINGSSQVTPEAVASVNAAVEQLHYVPNRAARSLVRRRAQTIAMVIPQRTAEFFADPYFAEVIQGAAMYASSTDYTLTLLIESDVDPDKTRRFLTGGNVDGALVLSHHTSMQAYAKLSASLPVVFGVRGLEPADPPGHVVDVDNVEAGALATQRLVDAGRRHIATIAGPLDTAAGVDRLAGWRRTLGAAGIEPGLQEEGDFTPTSGARAMERLLAGGRPVDAVFAASAQMATGALGVLRDRGIPVPVRIAMTSVDDNVFAADAYPALTTVDLRTAEKGALLVQTLHRLIAGEDVPEMTTIPCGLVERDSV
nr:LacI family DNA-binding transcriptional regulator [Plantibacter sp. LMC-P-059a]